MKVTTQYRQAIPDGTIYRAASTEETVRGEKGLGVQKESDGQKCAGVQRGNGEQTHSGLQRLVESRRESGLRTGNRNTSDSFLETMWGKSAEKTNGGFRMKSSKPDDSVGQLAAMLARAETRMDVQQVGSKAIRALTNLKMSAAGCEGKEAKKIAQQIRRMEKLIKRIHKKLEHLAKEERLEEQKKQAEKKQEEQKVREIREELRGKRNKRRRDEREYARKELAQDGKENLQEMTSSMMAGMSPSAGSEGAAFSGADVAAAPVEGVSIDVSV